VSIAAVRYQQSMYSFSIFKKIKAAVKYQQSVYSFSHIRKMSGPHSSSHISNHCTHQYPCWRTEIRLHAFN
jgi:hypothetical protein